MSPDVYQAMQDLRKFMFQNVYTNPVAKGQEKKAEKMAFRSLYIQDWLCYTESQWVNICPVGQGASK